ncbi:MAG: UDP-glucose 4-epimerase GalE [Candidatus Fimenecus sp.]
MAILVTGGAGFIGSHTIVELQNSGYETICVDNLLNSDEASLERVKKITGKSVKFYKADVCDKAALNKIFDENRIDAVIHFAGLKAVGESVKKPLEYYENNLESTLTLCKVMREHGCKNLVFSSSATVYGTDNTSPLKEDMKTGGTTNPYGTTKFMIEIMLKDIAFADPEWNITLLRYFNPIGAHESGLIGENPNGIPNNLMPYITQVAVGKLSCLSVYGDDYDTPDGTGVRDYIHVVDLAQGHVRALSKMIGSKNGVKVYNLGTGVGYSVLDVIKAFEKVSGISINYKIVERRAGDLATCYSDPSLAKEELLWTAKRGIDEMCRDSWNWQKNNPNGYKD